MADDGVVKRKIKEFADWTGITTFFASTSTPAASNEDEQALVLWDARVPPTTTERTNLGELQAEFEAAGKRILRLEEDIAAEDAAMRSIVAPYRPDPRTPASSVKLPQLVRIRVNGHVKAKKAHMDALQQTYAMRTSLQTQIHTIQNAANQRGYMRAMRGAHQALHENVNDANIADAENLMDDNRELNDRARELTSHIARPRLDLDDDELAEELDDLFAGPIPQVPIMDMPDVTFDLPAASRQPPHAQSVAHTRFTRLEEMLGE